MLLTLPLDLSARLGFMTLLEHLLLLLVEAAQLNSVQSGGGATAEPLRLLALVPIAPVMFLLVVPGLGFGDNQESGHDTLHIVLVGPTEVFTGLVGAQGIVLIAVVRHAHYRGVGPSIMVGSVATNFPIVEELENCHVATALLLGIGIIMMGLSVVVCRHGTVVVVAPLGVIEATASNATLVDNSGILDVRKSVYIYKFKFHQKLRHIPIGLLSPRAHH